ncbi:LIM domain-binding protein 2 [Papilio machaon]|uniref:LIM domain-binding protein 2 n=1 Tax=Papilio machaon TaxID=76193 RepID=A0A0N1PHD8_PAPMA|nr:LIM domain-binding protein 2 [Papilio machaon]
MPVALGSLGGEGEYREYGHHLSPHHPHHAPHAPHQPHAPHHLQYHEYAPPPPPPIYHPIPDPYFRRHAPYFGQPDYRVYELNKRLQQRTEDSDNLWWDAFATEFFEDDATLTLTFCLEDGPKRYTIGRTLIPRYFRSIYEGGVSELYYTMRQPKESFHNTSITLDCDHCTMVTHHGKPMFTKVCTEGRLILEFTFDDLMRIKSWHMAVRAHRELIPRQAVHPPDHAALDQLAKNITRQGITNSTLNYLRLCVILEPMQELMSRHKAYALSPRDCLKTTLFQKWQRMVAPPESQRPASKRRKRKGSAGANAAPPAPTKKRSPGPNFSLASQVIYVRHTYDTHTTHTRHTRTASRRHSSRNGSGWSRHQVYLCSPESQRPASKRRKRKGSAGANAAPPAPTKKRSPGPNFSLASQDVMVVGEPSLMGGEFGDEDERLITRLENTQYEGDVEWSAPPASPAKTPPAPH